MWWRGLDRSYDLRQSVHVPLSERLVLSVLLNVSLGFPSSVRFVVFSLIVKRILSRGWNHLFL